MYVSDFNALPVFEPIAYAHRGKDRVERLLHGSEAAVVDAAESPAEVGKDRSALPDAIFSSEVYAPLQVTHVVAEVIVAARAFVATEGHLGTRGIAYTQVAVVGVARELALG